MMVRMMVRMIVRMMVRMTVGVIDGDGEVGMYYACHCPLFKSPIFKNWRKSNNMMTQVNVNR